MRDLYFSSYHYVSINAYFIITDRYDITDIQEGGGKKRFIIDTFSYNY